MNVDTTFKVTMGVSGIGDSREEQVKAVVGTRASHAVLPGALLDELQVARMEMRPFILPDGSSRLYGVGQARIRLEGRTAITTVVFGDPDSACLVGATTLGALGLAVDPVNKRLVPTAGYALTAI